eukprot:1997343-Amphidinium_carterae.1
MGLSGHVLRRGVDDNQRQHWLQNVPSLPAPCYQNDYCHGLKDQDQRITLPNCSKLVTSTSVMQAMES